jgi:hypothetical protein
MGFSGWSRDQMIERIHKCYIDISDNYVVWCYFLSYSIGCIRIILLCEPNEQIKPLESLTMAPWFACLDDDGRLDNNPVSSCAGRSIKFRVEQIHGWLLRWYCFCEAHRYPQITFDILSASTRFQANSFFFFFFFLSSLVYLAAWGAMQTHYIGFSS